MKQQKRFVNMKFITISSALLVGASFLMLLTSAGGCSAAKKAEEAATTTSTTQTGYCNARTPTSATVGGFCQKVVTAGDIGTFEGTCTSSYGGTWSTSTDCTTSTTNRLGYCVYDATVSGVNSVTSTYFYSDSTGLYRNTADALTFCDVLNGVNGTATWKTIYDGTYKSPCTDSTATVNSTAVYYTTQMTFATNTVVATAKFYSGTSCSGTPILTVTSNLKYAVDSDSTVSGAQKVNFIWPSTLTATTSTADGTTDGATFFNTVFCASGNKTLVAGTQLDLAGNNCSNYGAVVAGDTEYTLIKLDTTNNTVVLGGPATAGRVFGPTSEGSRHTALDATASGVLTKQ